MARDARHDEVVLTQAERRALADLEVALGESLIPTASDTSAKPLATPGWRCRAVAIFHRWLRWGPWLVPIGVVLMLWALASSLLASVVGAILIGLGLAACLQQPWLRRRHTWLSFRRH